ncbi:type II secretion system protein [Desulforamulus ruminis]|uniref:type II secretion system protein n=1 Tax=Desulforamulus ruminis TaxID=1564 RepID=UPI002356A13C|nr:type II secretion system protein [Desulforamulus ruminis]
MFKRVPQYKEAGFTLLELIIVVAILGFLAAMIVPFAGHLNKSQRVQMTREKLESIREALLGPENTYDSQGLRVIGGYVGDLGELPKLYPSRWDDATRAWVWDSMEEEMYGTGQPRALWAGETAGESPGAGWKGPYLLPPRDPYPEDVKGLSWSRIEERRLIEQRQVEGKLSDAWGQVLYFIKEGMGPDASLLIVSAGPDGRIRLPDEETPGYNAAVEENQDNIILQIRHTEWDEGINQRYLGEETRRRLERIREALLGPDDAFDPVGRRLVGGYLGDVGRWPQLWEWREGDWKSVSFEGHEDGEEIMGQPRGLWIWHEGEGIAEPNPGFEWRGPYLTKPWGKGEEEVLRDAWGTPLRFALSPEGDPDTLTVTSAGADKDFDAEEDNQALQIKRNQWLVEGMQVSGSVKNETPKKYIYNEESGQWEPAPADQQPPDAVFKIKLYCRPEGEPLELTLNVPAGESRSFGLTGEMCAGRRKIETEVSEPVFSEVFIGSGRTQSPPEEKLVFIVQSE